MASSNAGAVVLRSNSDLVYLPDHGFVGEEGALRILSQVTRQIRRLDVSHNLLGPEGTLILIQGLNSLRGQFSTPDLGIWGLTEINLGHNRIADAGVDVIMGYAKKDVFLRKVMLQGNRIELRDNLDSITHALNSSRLDTLSLTDNKRLESPAISRFFAALTTPYLTELHLSICDLGPEVAPSVIDYLSSPRSRNLELLGLNGNNLGLDAVRDIIDAVEGRNFTIANLGLFSNGTLAASDPEGASISDPREIAKEEREREERHLGDQTSRLPTLFARNRSLTRRVQQAALRCLPRARILLNARDPSPLEIARQAIASISLSSSHTPYFRLLDLPPEVLYLIVRHTSGDATALSDAQYTRLRKDAEGKEGLARAMRMMRSKGRVWSADRSAKRDAEMNVREDWLKWGKWDKWESDVEAAPRREEDEA